MTDRTIIIPAGEYILTGKNAGLDQSDRPVGCRGEWIDLDEAMQMLEAPASEEEAVELLITEIGALITAYLGRNLLDCTHTDNFFRPNVNTFYLENFPVTALHSVRFDGERTLPDTYDINAEFGILVKAYGQPLQPTHYMGSVTVNYDAGYIAPPAELKSMFRAILVDYYSSGGSTEGAVGSIKKVSLTGVAAVEFNSPGITYTGVDQQLGVPNALKNYTGLLDRYKSDRVMGVV